MDFFNSGVVDEHDLPSLLAPLWISAPPSGSYGDFVSGNYSREDREEDNGLDKPVLPHKSDVDIYLFGFSVFWRSLFNTLQWLKEHHILGQEMVSEIQNHAINVIRSSHHGHVLPPSKGPERPLSMPMRLNLSNCELSGETIMTRHKEKMWIIYKKNVVIKSIREGQMIIPRSSLVTTNVPSPTIIYMPNGEWELHLPSDTIIKIISLCQQHVKDTALMQSIAQGRSNRIAGGTE